jgi:hypothetical protein
MKSDQIEKKKIEEWMDKFEKEFISRYCDQKPNDWIRLKSLRIQEPMAFIKGEVYELLEGANEK